MVSDGHTGQALKVIAVSYSSVLLENKLKYVFFLFILILQLRGYLNWQDKKKMHR